MRRYWVDWKLLGGFSSLIILMIAIGFIGIFQIQSLAKTVENLGRRYLPMQKATLEMRVSNSLYAMGIRNYTFWKSSRYIEAARAATDLSIVNKAAEEFDRQLDIYSSHIQSISISKAQDYGTSKQKQWQDKIIASEKELRDIGSMIINSVDKNTSQDSINKLLMTFESRLYRIDDFLDKTIQKENINIINEQLLAAESARKQAMLFLGWSLFFGVLIGGETAWLVYRNRKREHQRREEMVLQMIRTEERERQNLSAQVHDQMSQDLSGAKIYLGLIEQDVPDPSQKFKEKIAQSKKIISGLIEKTHDISLLLRPPSLDEVGLVDSIEALLLDYQRLSKAKYVYHKPEQELKLSPEHSLFLYRFTQEVLTNAAKYAQAKMVEISLSKKGNLLSLSYEDDGKGFDFNQIFMQPRRRREDKLKLGMIGLKERVELLGGSLRVDTAPNKGTKITVQLNC